MQARTTTPLFLALLPLVSACRCGRQSGAGPAAPAKAATAATDAQLPENFQMIPLQHTPCNTVFGQLDQLLGPSGPFPTSLISADQRTNSLIVRASPERMETIERLVKMLDQPTPAPR